MFRPLRRPALLCAVVLALFAPRAAHAQMTMVESGFICVLLNEDLAKQVELGVGGDSCIYYGSFDGLKRRCPPPTNSVVCDPNLTFPVGIAFSTGGTFGNKMYIADYGLGDVFRSTGCATATMFCDMVASGALAFPPTGSPYGDYLYACEAFDGPIYRINSAGVKTSWLALETLYLRFGPGGAWGTGMYATDMTDFANGKISRVSSTGVVTPFVADFQVPEGFDWGFDGDMFATDPTLGKVYRIKANGAKTEFANLGGVADVAWRPSEQALYVVSNQGGFYRVKRGSAVGVPDGALAGGRLVVTPNPSAAACALSFTLPAGGRVRAQVWDAAGRLVRRVADAWRPAGAQSIAWDGRDEAGARVRPGAYFARVETPGQVLHSQVTVVR